MLRTNFLTLGFTTRVSLICAFVGFGTLFGPKLSMSDEDVPSAPDLPPLAAELTNGQLQGVGRIRNKKLTIDRFDFELVDGELYLLSPEANRPAVAVFLGDGIIRCYPPDAVEHQQIEKFLDRENDDLIEESFDRFIFWFSDDTGHRLEELADQSSVTDVKSAQKLLKERREDLLSDRLLNPDGRLVADLLNFDKSNLRNRSFFFAEIDTDKNSWLSVEIEPFNSEEVQVRRFHRRRKIEDVWMRFHAFSDYSSRVQQAALAGFPRQRPRGL